MAWKLAKGKTWKEKLEQPHSNHGKLIALPPAARVASGSRPIGGRSSRTTQLFDGAGLLSKKRS